MTDPAFKIIFDKLSGLVKTLTNEEKKILRHILNRENEGVVQEEAVAYLKSNEVSFEEKWKQSITAKDFEKLAHDHIHQLPWK